MCRPEFNEAEILARLKKITPEIDVLKKEKWLLVASLREGRSRRYIEEHNITRGDVEASRDSGGIQHCSVSQFAKCLTEKDPCVRKRYAEWNGVIYRTNDLIQCDLSEPVANVSELPK